MKFGSVCSGIEAASVAWHPLEWEAAWLSEIEKFPSQVLAHHYPNTPNFGDMTKFKEWPDAAINVLVGGTPCQSFSVAGLRKGLDDPRGNLMLTYLAIAAKYRPKWLVWENVPGVLSSNGGLDFASLLRGMGELGYGFAYRVLDAQYFGVAQRRRRVFVVGYLGNWRPAAAVLFERHSLCGYPAPSREKRESAASTITTRTGVSRNNYEECVSTFSTPAIGSIREDILASCITKNTGGGGETQNPAFVLQPIAYVLSDGSDRGLHVNKAEVATCLDTSNAANEFREQSQNAATLVAQSIAYSTKLHNTSSNQSGKFYEEYTTSLDRSSPPPAVIAPAMAFPWQSALDPIGNPTDLSGTLVKNQTMAVAVPIGLDEEQNAMIDAFGTLKARTAGGGFEGSVMQPNMQVRRLTPVECERLQGFPDGYTDIQPKGKATPDGPRYKALGNSMAVPVMAWIGQRIQQVEDILG